jgi:sugar phosphate isomerase/epimerase
MSNKECFDYPVYMHVNFLENTFPVDQIIPRCADAGYDGIELRGYDINGKMSVADYLDYVYPLTEKYQLKVTFGCPTIPSILILMFEINHWRILNMSLTLPRIMEYLF